MNQLYSLLVTVLLVRCGEAAPAPQSAITSNAGTGTVLSFDLIKIMFKDIILIIRVN